MSAQNDIIVNKGPMVSALEGMTPNELTPMRQSTAATVTDKPLSVWDRLRLRLKKNANRMVSLKALTNEFGELVGFVVDDAQVIEGGKAG